MSHYVENHLKIGERRRHPRVLVSPQTAIKLGEHSVGIILNISQGGLALTSAEILTPDPVAPMQFQLPGSREWIETNGEVAWMTKSKTEAGIRFVNLAENTRKKIRKWTSQKSFRGQVGQEQRA